MNYSDLSPEDRKSMLELTENLISIDKQKDELLEKLAPLKKSLAESYEKISELNIQANNLYESIISENGTVNETIEYNNVLNDIDILSADILNYKSKIEEYKTELRKVLKNKDENIKKMNDIRYKDSNIYINEDGVVVIKGINVSNNKDIKINQIKNVIIKTNKNVSNFIKDKYEKAKNTSIELGKTSVQKLNNFYEKNIKANIEEITKEFMEGFNSVRKEYKEENDELDKMVDEYANKINAVENAAADIKLYEGNEIKEEKNQNVQQIEVVQTEKTIENSPILIEDQETKKAIKEGFKFESPDESNISKDNNENKDLEIPISDGNSNKKENLAEVEEANEVLNKDDLEVKNVEYVESKVVEDNKDEEKEDTNIFANTPTKESASNEKEEIKPFLVLEHFINKKKNQIAKTTKTKLNKMIETFIELPNYIGKFVANVKNDIDLQNYKKEKIAEITNRHNEEERKVLEENKEKLQKLANEYNNELENFENIFGKTKAA